jgi:hypothetical protein
MVDLYFFGGFVFILIVFKGFTNIDDSWDTYRHRIKLINDQM